MTREPPILHWREVEEPDGDNHYRGDDELMGLDSDLVRPLGLGRVAVHHHRLLPGRRTSYPHAESAEEEFVFVLAGTPDVWIDGHLHRLAPGDAVGFPAGTGIAHSFLNDTEEEVRLIVVGECIVPGARILYPCNPEQRDSRSDWWADAPERARGPHDGLTARRRAELARRRGG